MQTFLVDCWLVKAPNWIWSPAVSWKSSSTWISPGGETQQKHFRWSNSKSGKIRLGFPLRHQCMSHILALSKLFDVLSLPPESPSHFCPSWSHTGLIICDISKARYMSINTRACLYALKCKLLLYCFQVFCSSLSFFSNHIKNTFYSMYCIHKWEFTKRFSSPLTEPIVLQSQSWPQCDVLRSWCYIWLAVVFYMVEKTHLASI